MFKQKVNPDPMKESALKLKLMDFEQKNSTNVSQGCNLSDIPLSVWVMGDEVDIRMDNRFSTREVDAYMISMLGELFGEPPLTYKDSSATHYAMLLSVFDAIVSSESSKPQHR